MSLDDFHFDQKEKNFFEAVKQALDLKLTPLSDKLNYIYKALVDKKFIEPLATAKSLKQITKKGNELLKKYNVDSYIDENCSLLKDKKLKEKTEVQIFIEANKWIENEGKEKLTEIILNTNFPESLVKELLGLAILYKVKKQAPNK